jgi:membrane protein DedA with SNARE-associated domain
VGTHRRAQGSARLEDDVESPVVQSFVDSAGYAAIFLLMLAESACIPIPSEVTMFTAGALAASGHLGLGYAIVVGTLGNVVGSYLAWIVGRTGGRAVLGRFGRLMMLREDDVARSEEWFARHGEAAVFLGRFVPVVRTFISLPAGVAEMPPVRFGVYTLLGCLPWTAALAAVGYAVGDNWHSIARGFTAATYVIVAIAVVAIAAFFVHRARKPRGRHARRRGAVSSPPKSAARGSAGRS